MQKSGGMGIQIKLFNFKAKFAIVARLKGYFVFIV